MSKCHIHESDNILVRLSDVQSIMYLRLTRDLI